MILDCFTTTQEIKEDDFSLINVSCAILYMSAKYDNSVPSLDFYTFFAHISRSNTYARLLSFWKLQSSDIEWPEMIFNRIEAMVFESFPRFQINLVSPIEVCYDIASYFIGILPEETISAEKLKNAALNTYLCMSGKQNPLISYPFSHTSKSWHIFKFRCGDDLPLSIRIQSNTYIYTNS